MSGSVCDGDGECCMSSCIASPPMSICVCGEGCCCSGTVVGGLSSAAILPPSATRGWVESRARMRSMMVFPVVIIVYRKYPSAPKVVSHKRLCSFMTCRFNAVDFDVSVANEARGAESEMQIVGKLSILLRTAFAYRAYAALT